MLNVLLAAREQDTPVALDALTIAKRAELKPNHVAAWLSNEFQRAHWVRPVAMRGDPSNGTPMGYYELTDLGVEAARAAKEQ
jgi:hypothetical protein